MPSMPVSIIVRSMARSTLAEALDSIARQTYPDIEVIVVNALGPGHPPPGLQCGRFPLRFVDQGSPLDRSAAANAGLDSASSHYLGFLDDDDLLLPDHIAVLVEALQQSTTAQVAYSGVRMIAYLPDGTPGFETLLNQPFHRPSLRAQNYIPMHAVLFDRALLDAGCRFDEHLALYEDWDFWLQLAGYSEFLHVDQVTACYRNFGHSGFGLQADAAKIAAGRAALFDKWRKIWSGADLSEAFAALRDGIIHSPPRCPAAPDAGELLADAITRLEQSLGRLESKRRCEQELFRENQRRVDELMETTRHLSAQLRERSLQLQQVYQSTSWRMTWPLRTLVHAWRQRQAANGRWSPGQPGWPAFALGSRVAMRAWQILKTEGPWALAKKIRRRLGVTALKTPTQPRLLTLTAPFAPVTFPDEETPEISIIIPVFNQFHFTHHCLAALAADSSTRRFEVIVIDDGSSDGTVEALGGYAGVRLMVNQNNLGFVDAINRAASTARGNYLIFLNNDTQVQPGWLDALMETFDTFQDAGLAGSRLLYPGGRLQEAGGLVFADGSAWNYGHLDDPDKPEYGYAREPDYVSGAALAIRRELFAKLGGFDAYFAPAYYEDMDLAFRVRAAGYRVFYQPLSRVVHFEGASMGTDETVSDSRKWFQSVNRQKFVERWREELASHGPRGEMLERQKERRVRRRALIVDVYLLTPDRESGSLRMLNLLTILQEQGFKITFAAANLEAPEPYVANLQKRGVEVLYRPYVQSIDRHLRAHGDDYDLVILSRADAAAQVMAAARRYCRNARIVYDTVDLHFLREMRGAELTGDPTDRALAEQRKRQELGLIAQAEVTLVVSAVERDLLAREAPGAEVRIVSNIHPLYGSRKPFAERQGLLFIGAFVHPPNVDALLWFCREIFPRVLEQAPEMHLSVIGADPPAAVAALASEQVHILGYVAEIAPFFDGCRLSVAPLRYGAGVKGKITQSLAYGLPVVATTLAVEGMFLEDGESVLVADEPGAFAQQIVRLYRDPALWEKVSGGGLAVMEKHFGWAAARRALAEVVGV